jgi:hypothetical protein
LGVRKLKGYTFVKEEKLFKPDCNQRRGWYEGRGRDQCLSHAQCEQGFLSPHWTLILEIGHAISIVQKTHWPVSLSKCRAGKLFSFQSQSSFHCLWLIAKPAAKRQCCIRV